MMSLSKYQPNGVLVTNVTVATLDTNTGLASFKNMSIAVAGTYVLRVNIRSSDNSFTMACRSNPVRVLNKPAVSSTIGSSDEPNFKFVFNADYDALETNDELSYYKAMFMNYLESALGATIIGDVYMYKGSLAFSFNVDPTSSAIQSLSSASVGTDSVIPGMTLQKVQVYDKTFASSASSSSSSSSGSNVSFFYSLGKMFYDFFF